MVGRQKSNSCPVNRTISPQKIGKTVSMNEKHELPEYAAIDDKECQEKNQANKALKHHYETTQSKNRLDVLKMDARKR